MPKLFPPSLLETLETRVFYLEKQITDIDSLRYHLQQSIYLGIDIEDHKGIRGGITSIGLAILSPNDSLSKPFPSLSFRAQELIERYQIESHCLHYEGRCRRKLYPLFSYGKVIKIVDPSKEIEALLDEIKKRYPDKSIILAG